ncbi:pyrroloquinoline quinone biosynthesis protein PqqF [Pseudomonas paraeruginosa]|uniref:pyrroloquinoline quinone biosynthesis protein PqqF n=1 Tax=Pseudomonas paraeruginosa TaxID=2994495 RepID=UPI0037479ED7
MRAPTTQHLRLANGLEVTLLHAPRLNRCAAAVRIDAGSHDAPAAYPGLAHFLEHLLFLGSQQFAAADSLLQLAMTYGGQANATTRERHTEYFFELPVAACAAGLARLCDMLARPNLEPCLQQAEREVLHAEFLAWSRTAAAASSIALARALPVNHPLAAFHTGNRFSLPLQRPDFQSALRRFHRDFYHAGQASLVLLGPQPLAELRRLAEAEGGRFAARAATARAAPPALLPLRQTRVKQQPPCRGLGLTLVLQDLPAAAMPALELLCFRLADASPGSWAAQLRAQELAGTPQVELTYRYHDQALLQIDLNHYAPGAEEGVVALLFDWLRRVAAEPDWNNWLETYRRQKARQQASADAQSLARAWLQPQSPDVAACMALGQVLARLDASQLLLQLGECTPWPAVTTAAPSAGMPQRPEHFDDAATGSLAICVQRQAQPLAGGQGALFLRWRAAPGQLLTYPDLPRLALQPLAAAAGRDGLTLSFAPCGTAWELRLGGPAQHLPALLEACLARFADAPTHDAATPVAPGGQMLLRRLLQQVEGSLAASLYEKGASVPLARCRLDGLALGLSDAQWGSVRRLIQYAPGQPDGRTDATTVLPGRLWREVEPAVTEQALVLFCPLANEVVQQARGRLLGQLLQPSFYRYCRHQARLGYGVFGGYRRLGELGGLLLAVQSPHVDAAALLVHVEDFLGMAPDPATLERQRLGLLAQLQPQLLAPNEAATLLWQGYKHVAAEPQLLAEATRHLTMDDLQAAQQELRSASHGSLALGTGPAPDRRWRAMGAL